MAGQAGPEGNRGRIRGVQSSSSIQMGEPEPRGRLASEQLSPPEGADLDQGKPKMIVPTAEVKERGLTSREYQGSSP